MADHSRLSGRIGFGVPPVIRAEEWEEASTPAFRRRGSAEVRADVESLEESPEIGIEEPTVILGALAQERRDIYEAIREKKIGVPDALKMLAQNQAAIAMALGRNPSGFRTEHVIYSILAFSAGVTVVLAYLTSIGRLDVEVTTTFIGTVVGGTIATIAGKLGKIGR